MWADVTVRFKNTLHSKTFLSGLPPQCEKGTVLNGTMFENVPEMHPNIIYTHEGTDRKLILFDNGASSFIAHMQPKTISPSLGRIKDQVDGLVAEFFAAARNSSHHIQNLEVGIAFEEEV